MRRSALPPSPHLLTLPLSLVSLCARWSGDEDQLTVRPSPPHGLLRTGGAAQQGEQTGFPHQPLVFSSSFSTLSSSSSFFCCTLLNAKHCWPFPPALLRFEHFDNPSQLSADRTNNWSITLVYQKVTSTIPVNYKEQRIRLLKKGQIEWQGGEERLTYFNVIVRFTVRKLLRIAKYPSTAVQPLHRYAFVKPFRY